ncbi:Clr5 domain-containing protein [Aspergillus ambiguus]|uniref:Clr5 domain-containing protein n=1 Tax=Aspergillus ambiguus TaxID=176160 RepID=UPI003CCE20B7
MMGGSVPPSALSASSSSSSSAIFRPRRSDDWQEYRPVIEKLYRDDQLKLRDVKRIMEREYNFVASEKQYKDRLAAWHIRKNIKAKEVHVMIRKQQKRAARGKQTAFRVGGQEVDSKRIARFVRRYGTSWDKDVASQLPPEETIHSTSPEPAPETPSDMSCYTPDPDDRGSTLSPLPEMQPLPHDTKFDPNPDAELDDSRSLSTTLSPSLPNDTPKPVGEPEAADDPWSELTLFQDRLLALHQTLEKSMSGFTSATDDGNGSR